MTLPGSMTIGEAYNPAMTIETQEEADRYFDLLVERHVQVHGVTRQEAIQNERSNLGYYAGYFSDETRERVERLFRCRHPFLGAIAETGPLDPMDVFRAGVAAGEAARGHQG